MTRDSIVDDHAGGRGVERALSDVKIALTRIEGPPRALSEHADFRDGAEIGEPVATTAG